ncbi:MAG: hypothetical protein ACOC5B_02285, partial [Myxococcota bacterium]
CGRIDYEVVGGGIEDAAVPDAESCSNGAQDGDETDVDCGGTCPSCDTGATCAQGADCLSEICVSGVCEIDHAATWSQIERFAATEGPYADEDPTLTADELEMYFTANDRGPTKDIWRVSRASIADPWGTPERVAELSSDWEDNTPRISSDGLSIWLASKRAGLGEDDFYQATRSRRDEAWSTPSEVSELSDFASGKLYPTPFADGLELWFSGGGDIYRTTREVRSDPWGAPQAVAAISNGEFDFGPFPLDVNLVYFASGTEDHESTRIYVAWRPSSAEPFTFVGMPELDSSDTASDPWVSADGKRIYFSSRVLGYPQIYEASR